MRPRPALASPLPPSCTPPTLRGRGHQGAQSPPHSAGTLPGSPLAEDERPEPPHNSAVLASALARAPDPTWGQERGREMGDAEEGEGSGEGEGRGRGRGRKGAAALDAGAPPSSAGTPPPCPGLGVWGVLSRRAGLGTGTESKALRAGLTCPLKSLWAVV